MFDSRKMHRGVKGGTVVELIPYRIKANSPAKGEHVAVLWKLMISNKAGGRPKDRKAMPLSAVMEIIGRMGDVSKFKWESICIPENRSWDKVSVSDCVYFIEAVGSGRVKIGVAQSLSARMSTISPGCPYPMRVLLTLPGKRAEELEFHKRFAHLQKHNEWFSLEGDLLDFINEQNAEIMSHE